MKDYEYECPFTEDFDEQYTPDNAATGDGGGTYQYSAWAGGRPVEWPYADADTDWQPGAGAVSQGALRTARNDRGAGQRFTALTLAFCMTLSSAFGFFGAFAYDRYKYARGESGGAPVLYESVVRPLAAGDGAYADVTLTETAAIVKQTVVEINTETATRYGRLRPGAGSGVIVSTDGYIVTNHHVINNAETISVRLPDGKVYPAALVGSDSESDLAVIKIAANGLTPAVLGNSSTLQVGQTALAVGNPLGELGGTVTSGIISALDREIEIDEYNVMSLLQTDAAINPGNSGGGLFNLNGELIGIVNAKSTGVDIEGLGFAIPIDTAKKVIEDIIQIGYVRGRVSAGLEVISVNTPREAMMYRVNQTGLYISNSRDSKLQSGDRIVALNDAPITDFSSFKSALSKFKVGDTVNITVERGNDKVTAAITLTEMR